MEAGGRLLGPEHHRSGRHLGRGSGCDFAKTEDGGAVEAPSTKRGHSTGPAERSGGTEGPTCQDPSVIDR